MKKKLLLADDSITIQKVVGIIFATEDYELLTAGDGNKAFELALEHKPDLVIADITMPGKNGLDLCREIKSHPALGTTSVLLLPGAFEEFDEARAVEVCADGWLTKPFESQVLIDKVTALLEMPPLRLVAAADSEVADETPEAVDFTEQLAAQDADEPFATTAEDDSLILEEPTADVADEVVESADTEEDSDSEMWDAVSFEEEDLKPQELLAASDEEEEEPVAYSPDESDLSEPPQGLTPEQLAPYVSTPPSAPPVEEPQTPEFEPLADETKAEFQFVTDQPVPEEDAEAEESVFGEAIERDEPSATFEFEPLNTLEADNRSDDATADGDDEIELMEEDLDQEEELIEDSATFIDLTAAEEEGAEVVSADEEAFAFETDDDPSDDPSDDEILDLTESDILEEDETALAASHETPAFEAEVQEHGNLFVTPQEDQDADEKDAAAESFGRRDDNLFGDEDESIATPVNDDEPVASEPADDEAEFEAPDVVEEEFEATFEPEEIADTEETADTEEPADTEELADTEEMVAGAEDFAASTFDEPPLDAPEALASAELVEEQLRQLPEEEVARIVEKVAGPLVERLAREMLEQTIWEVVPDLAETMISAEIEKIKRGES